MNANQRIAENLASIRQRIAAAARRSGRQAEDILLVGVTKYVGPEEIRALAAAGCRHIGESRPQDLWAKCQALADQSLTWHLVGHLQRNKARRTMPLIRLLHSVDSRRLLTTIDHLGREAPQPHAVLLEVNISGDATKHGFEPAQLEPLGETLPELSGLEVQGLMTIASREGGSDQARRDFERLRQLRDQLAQRYPADICLRELSMGMSGDFAEAIEQGATIVRIGSALFA